MTPKQKAFVDEYLKDSNATQAYIRAGYSSKCAHKNASNLRQSKAISDEIKKRWVARAMEADEVLARTSDIARGSAEDYLTFDNGVVMIDLQRMKDAGKMHLVKKYKVTKQSIEVELYDAQAALVQMGKQHGLFIDRRELTGKGGEPLRLKFIDYGLDDPD